MRKGTCILLLVVVCLFMTGVAGWASRPVNHKSLGCVINGKVYSLYNAKTAYHYELPESFDLKPYEGKKVELEGTLSPGDRFVPKGKTLRMFGPCDPKSKELIRKIEGK